jgi:hypothetical protein
MSQAGGLPASVKTLFYLLAHQKDQRRRAAANPRASRIAQRLVRQRLLSVRLGQCLGEVEE